MAIVQKVRYILVAAPRNLILFLQESNNWMFELSNFIDQHNLFAVFILILVFSTLTYIVSSIKNIVVSFLERKKPIINNYYNCKVNTDDEDDD
jgi:uncharacterized PurR-regulated membrane protein YhhQ (DUF165 family)